MAELPKEQVYRAHYLKQKINGSEECIIIETNGSEVISRWVGDFENMGIWFRHKYMDGKPMRERTKEEVADEARRRQANFIIESSNKNCGYPYIFLKLNDENFLKRIRSVASVFG